MINLCAIIITVGYILYLSLYRKRNFLDFRVFIMLYFLVFYEIAFYSFYYLEQKIEYSQINSIGFANLLFIVAFIGSDLIITLAPKKRIPVPKIYALNIGIVQSFLFLFTTGLLGLYYIKAGGFPLFMGDIESTRIKSAESASGFVIALMQLSFLFFVIGLARYLKKSKVILIALVLFIIFYWGVLAFKRPLAGAFLMMIVTWNYGIKKISNTAILISLALAIVLISSYGSYRLRGEISMEWTLLILQALINVEINNLSLLLKYPPPMLWGETYLNAILMVFTDVKDIGATLKDYYGLTFKGGGITIGIIGEGYLNFRWLGIFLESLIFGLIVNYYSLKIRIEKNRFLIAKYSLYFYFLLWLLRNGLGASIVPYLIFAITEIIYVFLKSNVKSPVKVLQQ